MDKNTIILAKNGDINAFEEIVSFYEKMIFNYLWRVVKNKEDAKDITQNTFVKVFTHRKSIDVDKNLKTWIFTIATNSAYDFLRWKQRKNETSLEDNIETIEGLEAYNTGEGIVSDVDRALQEIDMNYKKALLLFYQQGFEYKEIADILGIPINTVKTHISRGKEQLKEKLKNYLN
jgi:RNA polymerase sigma-70 factor (ECF subfamily)